MFFSKSFLFIYDSMFDLSGPSPNIFKFILIPDFFIFFIAGSKYSKPLTLFNFAIIIKFNIFRYSYFIPFLVLYIPLCKLIVFFSFYFFLFFILFFFYSLFVII